ncbi:MAG: L-threonylcarbamoyladenylate synthase [Sphingomonadaceae bacterium]
MADATPSLPPVHAADAAGLAEATRTLAAGGLVAVPTETVYGLAADAMNPDAVAAIFAAKGRPAENPLIVHVAGRAMAARYARFSRLADALADRFWPGALTLVLPRGADAPLAEAVTAGLPTVALRVPAHPVMQALIAGLGRGIAAPSANVSGRLSPTRAEHLAGLQVPLVLDGGACAAGLESTVVKVGGPPGAEIATLLRPGAIPAEAIEAVTGAPLGRPQPGAVEAPGMHFRHYAPGKPLRLEATEARPGEVLIGFGAVGGDFNLSPTGDLAEAARNLFAALHAADSGPKRAIAVAPIPETGLGVAINDRLRRAARG